jgi:hypothetical protein
MGDIKRALQPAPTPQAATEQAARPAPTVRPAAAAKAKAKAAHAGERRAVDAAGNVVPPKKEGDKKGKEGEKPTKPKKKAVLPEAIKKMKKGKWKEYAIAARDIAKQYGMSENDPMIKFAIVLCVFMSKYESVLSFIPGHYRKSLDKGDFAKERLEAEQKKRLLERLNMDKIPDNFKDFSAFYKSSNELRKAKNEKPLDASETSTLYASYLLFGSPPKAGSKDAKARAIKHLTNHKVLAARIAHDSVRAGNIYGDATFLALKNKETIPRGTVIFFSENIKAGTQVAYATGNLREFKYFVPGMTVPKTFQFGAPDSPVKNTYNLKAAFIPNAKALASVKVAPSATATPATTPPLKPKGREALPAGIDPEKLVLSGATDLSKIEKAILAATRAGKYEIILKSPGLFLDLTKLLEKIENISKAVKAKPAVLAKIKANYEKLISKYGAAVASLEKEMKKALNKMKEVKTKNPNVLKALAAAEKAGNKLKTGRLKIDIAVISLYDTAKTKVESLLSNFKKYLARAKACLPKGPTAK